MKPMYPLLLALLLAISSKSFSQIDVGSTTPVTENFDAMGLSGTAPLPSNWKMSPAGASSPTWDDINNVTVTNFAASSGTPITGGSYNWGKTGDADRSLGFISSQSYISPNSIMSWYRNTGSDNINSLTISYDLFQFRINTATPVVSFYYSTDGSTWTHVSFGDAQAITTGASSYNFSDPANFGRSTAAGTSAFTIKGLSIPINGDFYLRWDFKTVGSSSSEGLGLDNVQLVASFGTITTSNGITSSAKLKENFDNMGLAANASLPSNWRMSPPGSLSPTWSSANNLTTTTFAASSGSPVTGGRYNWAQTGDTDRAIGFISSQSYLSPNSVMASYTNADTRTLTSLKISYDLFQFRINTAQPTVSFYYSTDGSTWIPLSAGDAQPISTGSSAYTFTNPPNFGRSEAAGTSAFVVPGLDLAPGQNVYLMWTFRTIGSSSSEGLGLDNVEVQGDTSATITRGPYLNLATQNSIVVRWRTDIATSSSVEFGLSPDNLTDSVTDATTTQEHIIELTGLSPNTLYYYTVGSSAGILQGDANNYFKTLPPVGSTQKVRVLAMGDMGVNSTIQRNVRDAYLNYNGTKYTDVWLLVGDNAYENGLDDEYQTNFFNIYQGSLTKNHVLWPAPGNHDYANNTALVGTQSIPYYNIFSTPTNGEAGGVPSGTKEYYSYNNGNIHFISLQSYDAETSNNALFDTTSPQAVWLKQDLAANTQRWTIVYFHYPPYSKGGVNSDNDPIEFRIRNNIVPILERYKVDLVLSGHDHDYERSFLINGHYGLSNDFDTTTMALSSSSGKYDGSPNSAPYIKDSTDSRNGIVYSVIGSAGQIGGTSSGYPHHAMEYSNVSNGGCMVIEVEDNRLDAKWLCSDGVIRDNFTIMKDVNKTKDTSIEYGTAITLNASWIGDYVWSDGESSRSITISPTRDTSFVVHDAFNDLKDSFHIVVTNQPQPIASATATVINCHGGSATVTVTATGGIEPYTGTGEFQVPVGTYSYIVTDANGNADTASITVNEPDALSVTATKAIASECSDDGTITLKATGGTSPFTYSLDGVNFVSTNKFTGLASGTYTGYVQDATCPDVVSIQDIVVGKASPINVTAAKTIASECADDGSITLRRTGGVGPFTYSIDGSTFVSTNKFTGLTAGTYTGYVQDSRCPVASLDNIVISKASPIVVKAGRTKVSECGDGADGAITLYRSGGGVGPFTYSLDGVNFVSTNKFTGLAEGTYTGYVQDSRCPVASLDNIVIGKASPIVVKAAKTIASECADDGIITLYPGGGGVGPFTYSLDGVNFVSTNKFTGLAAGTYTGYVQDSRCPVASLDNIVVGKAANLVVKASKTNASDCLSSDGSITLTRTGGNSPFSYSLTDDNYVTANTFSNLQHGTYNGWILDARGCKATLGNIVVGPTDCASPITSNTGSTGAIQSSKALPGNLKIQAYPNPTLNQFTLQIESQGKENVRIVVTDIYGKKIFEADGSADHVYTFGSNFPSGMYIVQVMQGKNIQTKKLIKGK
jgi:guanyl-specific ribonuclease Sa